MGCAVLQQKDSQMKRIRGFSEGNPKIWSGLFLKEQHSTYLQLCPFEALCFFKKFMLLLIILNPCTLYVKGREWLIENKIGQK